MVEKQAYEGEMIGTGGISSSERLVCELMGVAGTTFCYQSRRNESELRDRQVKLPWRIRDRRLHVLLRREEGVVNYKKAQCACG